MLRHRFTQFLAADRLHFAAHSHHLWPDVTLEAHQRAWNVAASLADEKWEVVFDSILNDARASIARILGLPDPTTIALATNTHELVTRIASSLDPPFRVVTSTSEFHSFRRQVRRWEEEGLAEVIAVPTEPFASFTERFVDVSASAEPDLVYLSQVFYDSGYIVDDLASIVAAVDPSVPIAIDGYHAFMAIPVDIADLAGRVFYLGGGYKYAMAGEGACFMHCPPGYIPRPVNTGWMAEFGALSSTGTEVGYASGGDRFLGATFDPSGFYRFNAVQKMLQEEQVTVAAIHEHVRWLQTRLIEGLDTGPLTESMIVPAWPHDRGNFLTFRTPSAPGFQRALRERGIVVDHRGDHLRFGFGVYHEPADVDRLVAVLRSLPEIPYPEKTR